jgi:D-inositol-3-phosphate glycosyltransferase
VDPQRIPQLLRSADVVVCPSWYESFGMAVVEAMACGVPVVASEAGGMVDTVIHEVTGLLVAPRSPRRLFNALNDVLQAGALSRGMGLAGRARAQACYSWDRIAVDAETIYGRAIDAVTATVPRAAGGAARVATSR